MSIRAVVFDIGGVLEITPDRGVAARWEARLELPPGALHARLGCVWRAGSLGEQSEADVHRSVGEILGIDAIQVAAFMQDIWEEYLGDLNVELAAYFGGLRPRYRTALLSNSFVGARSREEDRYRFSALTDLIIYSHEVGVAKPERRIYELTCERLGLRPDEIAFVDDVEPNVAAARTVGFHAILFRDTAQAIADLQRCLLGRDP